MRQNVLLSSFIKKVPTIITSNCSSLVCLSTVSTYRLWLAPKLRNLARTYSSCVSQTAKHLFMAITTNLNYAIYKGNVRDVYAHSPGHETSTFIRICNQFADWVSRTKRPPYQLFSWHPSPMCPPRPSRSQLSLGRTH
jgi:hypothetical protein